MLTLYGQINICDTYLIVQYVWLEELHCYMTQVLTWMGIMITKYFILLCTVQLVASNEKSILASLCEHILCVLFPSLVNYGGNNMQLLIYTAATWRYVVSRWKISSHAFTDQLSVLFIHRRMVKLNAFLQSLLPVLYFSVVTEYIDCKSTIEILKIFATQYSTKQEKAEHYSCIIS